MPFIILNTKIQKISFAIIGIAILIVLFLVPRQFKTSSG